MLNDQRVVEGGFLSRVVSILFYSATRGERDGRCSAPMFCICSWLALTAALQTLPIASADPPSTVSGRILSSAATQLSNANNTSAAAAGKGKGKGNGKGTGKTGKAKGKGSGKAKGGGTQDNAMRKCNRMIEWTLKHGVVDHPERCARPLYLLRDHLVHALRPR